MFLFISFFPLQKRLLLTDLYGVLGVDPSATVEELKSAHIRLALKYHPDMAGNVTSSSSSSSLRNGTDMSMNDREARFREVSEAWSILSKTDTRSRYDSFRARQGYNGGISMQADGTIIPTEIPLNYDTQRANFASVKHAASSNWKELNNKYKTEKWQNMPLPEKKLLRSRNVGSLAGTVVLVAIPCILIGSAAYSYWSSHFGVEASKTRKKLPGRA